MTPPATMLRATPWTPDGRIAVYYAPTPADPLLHAGSTWLGRDATADTAVLQPSVPHLEAITAKPRTYGFHATLKAPFTPYPHLDLDTLTTRLHQAAAACRPFPLPSLSVAPLDGFLALLERHPSAPLHALADRMVTALDDLRAPPTPADLARRRASTLSPAHRQMLAQWGYPDVLALWRFHMTLSGRLTPARQADLLPLAQTHFAAACALDRQVTDICLFVQPTRARPFQLVQRIPLG